mmetsp:Transcript_20519/g.17906  ORF Transcript_20519/g.17906 Transcript_20519/m.17906 type:complete len:387 (-) Transcript_20519:1458-2618(-)|eukprot:CAMPEP_0114587504 /NCGR_PEP_ID=MMETSP0125-20121206/10450_1 /TAXON_ID=485358 ORGANISM="Aristerostoma sp., Strain ATCC 50986" /NCGR_SAMPLE_ID=MMETSP0125 /ASSEMBLY_ACC=CAM_ASM_000245 /LENGTH=386 /DNA_ID=CAMNT_0001783453 /DNA_START=1781 /DNA_END=2941 /DNA_ORIENTATION=+
MREDHEKYEKWKASRSKELYDVKKKNIEKDALINKLKCESRRKDVLYKRKTDELLAKYMGQELYKQIRNNKPISSFTKKAKITRNNNNHSSTQSSFMSNNNSSFMSTKSSFTQQKHTLTDEEGMSLVENCSSNVMNGLEISQQIEKEEEALKQTEHALEIERNKYSEIVLKRERLEMQKRDVENDMDAEETLDTKISEFELEISDISNRIESLEDKLEYQLGKINQLTKDLSTKSAQMPENMLFNNDKVKGNPNNYQTLVRCLLAKHISTNLDYKKINDKLNQNQIDYSELKKRLDETEQKAKLSELQYEINLTKLTKEYERNQMLLMRQEGYDNEDNEYDKENFNKESSQNSHSQATDLSGDRSGGSDIPKGKDPLLIKNLADVR